MDHLPETETEVLFHKLVGLSPELAAERLLEWCPDRDRRCLVEQMLAADRLMRQSDCLGEDFIAGLPEAIVVSIADSLPAHGSIWKGKFQLLNEIGRGGMGVVYRALDSILNREVALKVIQAGQGATKEEIELFEHEARVMASLHHANIVTIYDFQRHGGESWIAMALLGGESLHAKLAARPMNPREVAKILTDVARAVAFAHKNNVIHRDLKPSNIFIQSDGSPMVTDFGISSYLSGDRSQEEKQLRLSIYYCAPERFSRIDGFPSDIYSIGAILYACLTGRPPHYAASESVQSQILNEPIVPPRTINSSIDADLNTICMKCLEREPLRRYASAQELAEDFQRFLDDKPIVARPPTIWYRAQMYYRRNRMASVAVVSAISVSVLFSIIAIGALGFGIARSVQSGVDQRERHMALARSIRDQRGPGQRFDSLWHLEEAARIRAPIDEAKTLELRNSIIESVCLPDLEAELSLKSDSLDVCAVDRDFKVYAVESSMGVISVRRMLTDEAICRAIRFEGSLVQMRFTEDLQFLGVVTSHSHPSSGHRLQVFDLNAAGDINADAVCLLEEWISGTSWQFLQKGSAIGCCRMDGQLIERMVGDSASTFRKIAVGVWADDLCFSHDEKFVALALPTSPFVRVFDCASGNLFRSLDHPAEVQAVRWTQNGTHLATASRSDVRVWEMPSGGLQDILKSHQTFVNTLAFSEDGNLLASHSWDGQTNLWDVRTGSRLIGFSGMSSGHFHRDRRRFAGLRTNDGYGIAKLVTDDNCRVICIPETADDQNRTAPDRGVWCVDFLPGRSLVAAAHLDGVSFLTSDGSRAPIHTINVGHCTACRFLPDGSGFVTSGKSGVLFWPIRFETNDPPTLEIGWPAVVRRNPAMTGHSLSIGTASDLMAVMDQNRQCVHVEYFHNPNHSFDIPLHCQMDSVSLHPDSTHVAIGTWNQEPKGVQVIPLTQGSTAIRISQDHEWPNYGPDGCLLLSTGETHRVVRMNGSRLDDVFSINRPASIGRRGIAAFSRSEHWAALSVDDTAIQIIDSLNGKEVATLRTRDSGTVTSLSFSDDACFLAASFQNRVVRVWNLQKIQQTLQPHGLDWSTAAVRPESTSVIGIRMLNRESSLELKYPPAFELVTRMPGEMNEFSKTSLTEVASQTNSDPDILYKSAVELAEAGEWHNAAERFQQALAASPATSKRWYLYALVQLKLGNAIEYRHACRELVSQFGSSPNKLDQAYVTWTCVIGDEGVDNWDSVTSIADTLVSTASLDPKGHTYRNTRGLLYLRMKRYHEARDELNIAIRIHASGGNPSDWLGLAMAEQALGNPQVADELYQKANSWIDGQYSQTTTKRTIPWNDMVEYSLFRQQARVCLGATAED